MRAAAQNCGRPCQRLWVVRAGQVAAAVARRVVGAMLFAGRRWPVGQYTPRQGVRASGGTNELLWPKSGPQQSFPKQKNTSLLSFYCGGVLDSGVYCLPGRENGAAAASLSSVVPTAPFSPTAASSTPRTGRTVQGQTGAVGEPGGRGEAESPVRSPPRCRSSGEYPLAVRGRERGRRK